jgi:hypothetical protein
MRKIILIGLFLLVVWPSAAQSSRTATYTSYDGVLQVSYMRGWRIGTVEPDMESFEGQMLREMPETYSLTLFHSNPDAEIRFFAVDMAERIPEDEDVFEFLQASIPPEIEFTISMLGENEALEFNITTIPSLAMGRTSIDLSGARRFIVTVGRNNWLIAAVLLAEDETLEEEFMTIAESLRFNGSNRTILSLAGNISITVPEDWFRYDNQLEVRKGWESLAVHGMTGDEYCIVSLDLIALDSPEFEFPEEASNDEYLEGFLNGRDIEYEALDIYAEHLAEGVSLYMTEAGEDYQYLSVQVLEDTVVIAIIYLGEGLCIDDYFSLINSIREEE